VGGRPGPGDESGRPFPRAQPDWHAMPVDDVLRALETRLDGLDEEEARRRLGRFGANRLRPPRPTSALHLLVTQFQSIVVWLLVGAALVSFAMDDRLEAAAIGVVIALNAGMGFVIELRARRAMDALLQLDASRASVVRDGRLLDVSADVLVPGDVVQLDAGHTVPADARILTATDLRVSEAALTGESLPVEKRAAPVAGDGTPLAERTSMVYKGTTVGAGTGRGVVVHTGDRTEVGRIGVLAGAVKEERTPLERRLDALGRRLVWLALGVAGIVAALGVLQGAPAGLMVELSIALAVAAVPEGLPAVATIALAIGLRRMARRKALVRRLPAVEALGSTTVICTDKTRTLTSGEMSIVRVWAGDVEFRLDGEGQPSPAGDPGLQEAIRAAVLASRTQAEGGGGEGRVTGDPVDRAVLQAAARVTLAPEADATRQLETFIPFSSERAFMAAFSRRGPGGRLVAHVKGAPHRVLEMCGHSRAPGGDRPLTPAGREALLDVNRALGEQGLRVLAVAAGAVAEPSESSLTRLTFLGFLGLMDPPAPGVKDAIKRLRTAGLRTIMLTGDQRSTAEAVGRELGVLAAGDQAIDSRELQALEPGELDHRLPGISTFSRISPEDKLTIVEAFQRQGAIVAMLGDGVNDAPALRKADVGVSMGIRGTDVAKEAAAIVLEDDRFETIVAAVEEGRVIFDNIRKFVFFLFSCNAAEVLVLLVAGVLALPLPLLPLQILWLNLVTDTFPALALAMEPGDPDVMTRPPRDPQEAILSRAFLSHVLWYASLITVSTLAAFLWALGRPSSDAPTVAFMTLALAQVFHLGNARSARPVVRLEGALSNRYALGAVVLCVGLQLCAVYVPPLAGILRVAPPGIRDWAIILPCAALTAVVGQGIRAWKADPPATETRS